MKSGDHQGMGARSNGFGTHPRTWIREGGRKSVCVCVGGGGGINRDFWKYVLLEVGVYGPGGAPGVCRTHALNILKKPLRQ